MRGFNWHKFQLGFSVGFRACSLVGKKYGTFMALYEFKYACVSTLTYEIIYEKPSLTIITECRQRTKPNLQNWRRVRRQHRNCISELAIAAYDEL